MTTTLTGLRSNGELTLGNYAGAILPMLNTQNNLKDGDRLHLFLPDLHSFVTPVEHSELYDNTINNTRIFLACGINPGLDNVIMYRQSHIPAHSEMMWILNCFTYFGELSRMTQFKDKSTGKNENVAAGLMNYPVLMAGDILLYNAEWVPVGDDQKQHLELTRDVANRINNKFDKEVFTIPKPWKEQLEHDGIEEGIRIKSLRNPTSKMSKSVDDPSGTILLSDEPAAAAKKIMRAETDQLASINWDWDNQPGVTNLLQLNYLLGNKTKQETVTEWTGNERYGDLKKQTAEYVSTFLTGLQENMQKYSDKDIEQILENSEKEATEIANKTLLRLQKAVGLKK